MSCKLAVGDWIIFRDEYAWKRGEPVIIIGKVGQIDNRRTKQVDFFLDKIHYPNPEKKYMWTEWRSHIEDDGSISNLTVIGKKLPSDEEIKRLLLLHHL